MAHEALDQIRNPDPIPLPFEVVQDSAIMKMFRSKYLCEYIEIGQTLLDHCRLGILEFTPRTVHA